MRSVYQLEITLKDVSPRVWRSVLIPSDFTLAQVQEALLTAMGWEGCHLYSFSIENSTYVEDTYDWPEASTDPGAVRLGDLVAPGDEFEFHYDFGDGWEHRIIVTDRLPTAGQIRPTCIAGQGACPPEDVGGPWGYANFLRAIADPEHERHAELLEWCGGRFDAQAFEAQEVDRIFARLHSASA
jgi:hypothetical protein